MSQTLEALATVEHLQNWGCIGNQTPGPSTSRLGDVANVDRPPDRLLLIESYVAIAQRAECGGGEGGVLSIVRMFPATPSPRQPLPASSQRMADPSSRSTNGGPLPACLAGERDELANAENPFPQDPCRLVRQVNQIGKLKRCDLRDAIECRDATPLFSGWYRSSAARRNARFVEFSSQAMENDRAPRRIIAEKTLVGSLRTGETNDDKS